MIVKVWYERWQQVANPTIDDLQLEAEVSFGVGEGEHWWLLLIVVVHVAHMDVVVLQERLETDLMLSYIIHRYGVDTQNVIFWLVAPVLSGRVVSVVLPPTRYILIPGVCGIGPIAVIILASGRPVILLPCLECLGVTALRLAIDPECPCKNIIGQIPVPGGPTDRPRVVSDVPLCP